MLYEEREREREREREKGKERREKVNKAVFGSLFDFYDFYMISIKQFFFHFDIALVHTHKKYIIHI